METEDTKSNNVEQQLRSAEKERLLRVILSNKDKLTAEYRSLIRYTGGLLTSSMVYAYTKGINDTLKLLAKDKNEKPVQTQES